MFVSRHGKLVAKKGACLVWCSKHANKLAYIRFERACCFEGIIFMRVESVKYDEKFYKL